MPEPARLTERRKADRIEMAAMVKKLCDEFAADCDIETDHPNREIDVRIRSLDAHVHIDFDGSHFNSLPDVYCMPWNVEFGKDRRFSSAFGVAVGADVNPHHRRKCMGFAEGIEALLVRLRLALECLADDRAFEA